MPLADLALRLKLENSSDVSRTEVFRFGVPLPDDNFGVTPTELINGNFHLQLVGGAATKYPTSWTVMSTWTSGRVKWAGAYISATLAASTIAHYQLINDNSITVPTFVLHPAIIDAEWNSFVRDRLGANNTPDGNLYLLNFSDSQYYREEVVESNSHVHVVRRRGYHAPIGGGTGMEANIGRDFLSCTLYIYTYTNSPFVNLELRLANDYLGQDNFTTAVTDYGDPNRNLYPLGPVAFKSWLFSWNNTVCDIKWEGKQSTATTAGGEMIRNAYLMFDPNVVSSTSQQYLIDDNISKGHATDYEFGPDGRPHMPDASNMCRKATVFFNNSSPTTTENNTWLAKTDFYGHSGHAAHAIPHLDTINRTRAHGVMEGTYAITSYKVPATQTLWTEEEIHDIWRRRLTAYMTGAQDYPWTTVDDSSQSAVRGSHGTFGGAETGVVTSGTGGQNRAAMDACCLIYLSQSWECVQTYYLQAIATAMRPGKIYWNLLVPYNREGTLSGQSGGIRIQSYGRGGPNTPFPTLPNEGVGSPRQLNRRFRKGFAMGTVAMTTGSPFGTITASSAIIKDGGWPCQVTPQGNLLSGLYRVFVRGDSAVRQIVSWNGNTFQMDGTYAGANGTYEYALSNDPEPSYPTQNADIKYSTSPSGVMSYIRHRAGMGRNYDGDTWPCMYWMNGEDLAHYSQNLAFEMWQVTGSWMCWDITRHASVAALAIVRDDLFIDQLRTNAWIPKAWLMGYEATGYLGANGRASDVGGLAAEYKAAALFRYNRMHNEWSGGNDGLGYKEIVPGRATSPARGCVASDDGPLWSTTYPTENYGAITGTGRSTFSDAFGHADLRLYSSSPLVFLIGYHASAAWQVAWVSSIEWAWWRALRDDADPRVAYIRLQAEWLADFLYDYCLTWDPNNPSQFAPGTFPFCADAQWQPAHTHVVNTQYGGPGKPNIKNWVRLAYNGSVPALAQQPAEALAGLGISHPNIGRPDDCIPDPLLSKNRGLNEPGVAASPPWVTEEDLRSWNVPPKLQAYHMYGDSPGAGYGTAAFSASAFGFSYRYNSDITKRALHGAIIKAWMDKFREDGQVSGDREQTPVGFTENHAVNRRFYLANSGDYPFDVESDVVNVGTQSITITQLDPTLFIAVDTQSITIEQQTVTVQTDADVIIGANPQSITITQLDPTVTTAVTVFPGPQSITITQLDPTLFIAVDTQSITITQLDPIINGESVTVFVNAQSITIEQLSVGVNSDNIFITVGAQSITIHQLPIVINGVITAEENVIIDEVDAGVDGVLRYQVTINGVPIDISDADAITYKLANNENSVPFLSKTLGDGITLIDGGFDGKFEVAIDAADTIGRKYGKPYFETRVIVGGETLQVRSGILTTRPSISV